MQNVLVTGLNGRLAPYLKEALESMEVNVVPFDRAVINIEDRAAQLSFIQNHNIDAIFHLATGSESWVTMLAGIAKELDIPFLFTSTESVFEPSSKGPFTPDRKPDATGDYGRYKIACENAALEANPDVIIARLGWQMFDTFEADNLLTHVRELHDEKGFLYASTKWRPAVAFVRHTMQCLLDLMDAAVPGIYHVGGNENELTFFDIVNMVNEKYDMQWDVREGDDPARDGRIIDERVPCGLISDVLQ
jgi:dTDP-4-dehydrorhamnose reductase